MDKKDEFYARGVGKVNLYHGDFFDKIKEVEDNSVDLVLTDPPYGTTSIHWDKVLNFDLMWKELKRVIKPHTNIILFGSQPFSSKLILSNIDWFKYELIWNKNKCGSPGLSKYRPQKVHENIMIFGSSSKTIYNPIMEEGTPYYRFNENGYGSGKNSHNYGFGKNNTGGINTGTRYPKSILHASRNFSAQQTTHPTQKPTNLLNWLIMTYSNPGHVILDFTMGTGATGVSAKLTSRDFIGIEINKEYFDIAKTRIELVEGNIVTRHNRQLTTQISEDMITVPNERYERIFLNTLKSSPSNVSQSNEFFDF